MHTRQERIAPYAMTLIYYGMALYLMSRTLILRCWPCSSAHGRPWH